MKSNLPPASQTDERQVLTAARFLPALLGSLLLAAVLFYAFRPVLTQTYGYNDDYPLLWRKVHRVFATWTNEFAQQGRPLGGLIWIDAFSFPRSLEQLTGVRALALVGTWLLACLQLWHLRRLRYSAPLAVGLSLATVLTPAFGVLVGWAELWSYPYASVLAYVAGIVTWEWATNAELHRQRWSWGTHATVGCLLILGHATYQPSATYFMLAIVAGAFAARDGGLPPQDGRATFRALARSTAVFVFWTAIYFAAYKGLLAILGSPKTGATVRAELVSDLGGKLRYLFGPVLWCSLSSWLRLQAFVWQVVTAALVVAGVLGAIFLPAPAAGAGRRFRPDWVSAAAILGALAVAVSPLAVVKENNVAFRTLPTVFAVLIFSALLGWRAALASLFPAPLARVSGAIALFATVLFLVGATRHHLHHGLAKPNRVELAELRRVLHERFDHAPTPPERVVYVFPSPYIWEDRTVRPFAEFGARSSPQQWVTPAMLHLILEERFGAEADVSRTEICVPPAQRADDPVVDGFTLLDGPGATIRSLPRVGEVRILPSGWCVSPWLGAFDATHYPSIYHPQLGWIFCMQNEPTPDVVFAPLTDPDLGWITTSPERFPEFRRIKTGATLRLSLRVSPEPHWLDPVTGAEIGLR